MKNLLFDQDIDLETLKLKIQSQINRYISSIKLKDILINTSEDRHIISISLTYAYILDNSAQSIQLNFS